LRSFRNRRDAEFVFFEGLAAALYFYLLDPGGLVILSAIIFVADLAFLLFLVRRIPNAEQKSPTRLLETASSPNHKIAIVNEISGAAMQ
jgi:hypothetical protein